MEAARIIDQKIASLSDWRGELLASLRQLIHEVDPAIVEEWKWMGTPVWNHDGIVCLANAHNGKVKVTFPKGARLPDPRRVFNAELAGNAWRAIDLLQGDALDVEGVKGLVRAAIALNSTRPAARKAGSKSSVPTRAPVAKKATATKKRATTQKRSAKQPRVAKK